jgi:hypothetical protein
MDYLSLCLICKDENDYLAEWLDYHILLGVDRFYIYDNGSQISLRETLADYIQRGWVVVIDIKGLAVQLYAYDHCLQNFGKYSRWIGFIDTDEFFVSKGNMDLKELLKGYEDYGGLAVSSIFFGSNGHKNRPVSGQIAAYTRAVHPSFATNELVKSIVQPDRVLLPNSPHDFIYHQDAWCVNEDFYRVDNQNFPNHVEKIQLNHYYCRSESELETKLNRGRGAQVGSWPRKRYQNVNKQATQVDTAILQTLATLFKSQGIDPSGLVETPQSFGLLKKLADQAKKRQPVSLEFVPPREAFPRAEFASFMDVKAQIREAESAGNHVAYGQLLLKLLEVMPSQVYLCCALAHHYIEQKDMASAWQFISIAWQLAPDTYCVLFSMAYFFLNAKNFPMAEKTCYLLREIAPHKLTILGFLTHALIGQERYEEALAVGVPVIELASVIGELAEGMEIFLVIRMADYLLSKPDFSAAVQLLKNGVNCQPGNMAVILALIKALLLQGSRGEAKHWLAEAQRLDPHCPELAEFWRQANIAPGKKHKK